MKLQPIIYTTNPAKAVRWYGQVLGLEPSYQSDVWTTFDVAGADLAIHRVEEDLPSKSRVGLSLVATEPLEGVVARLESAEDVEITRGIQDETFGRSLLITDPDGTVIQVNEHG